MNHVVVVAVVIVKVVGLGEAASPDAGLNITNVPTKPGQHHGLAAQADVHLGIGGGIVGVEDGIHRGGSQPDGLCPKAHRKAVPRPAHLAVSPVVHKEGLVPEALGSIHAHILAIAPEVAIGTVGIGGHEVKAQVLAKAQLGLECELKAVAFESDAGGEAGVVALSLPQGSIVLAVGGGGIVAVVPFRAVDLQVNSLEQTLGKPVFRRACVLPQGEGGSQIVSGPHVAALCGLSLQLPLAVREGAVVQGGTVCQPLQG